MYCKFIDTLYLFISYYNLKLNVFMRNDKEQYVF